MGVKLRSLEIEWIWWVNQWVGWLFWSHTASIYSIKIIIKRNVYIAAVQI